VSTATLTIDVSASGTGPPPGAEPRAIAGEDFWLPPTGSAGMIVTERTAMSLAAVLATFNVLATDVAVLPLCTYQRQADGGRREAREHPVDRLLRVSPDDETTPIRWRQALMGHALSRGNGYAEVQRKGRGTPIALHLLGPDTTRPERHGGRLGYDVGGGKWLESANVLHIAGLGDDGLSGFNFVRMLRQAIGLGIAGDTYAADYFSNGAEPLVVLETANALPIDARKNLKTSWDARHAGPGNRHGTAVLEQGVTAKTLSTDPEKSQLLETRKFQALDAVRPWRVPPHKIGDFSEAHLANLEAANLDYLMTALMGWLTAIEQEFTLKLLTAVEREAGYYVEHNVNALLRGDSRGRFESYNTALNGGWMNRDEVRRRENMNPIGEAEGGELYLVQSQNIPLSDVGKEPAAPEAPPAAPPPGGRTLRFNPSHGADGKFTSKGGGGGGKGGGGKGGGGGVVVGEVEVSREELRKIGADVANRGAAQGEDWRFEVGGPRNAREEKLSAKAEANDKFLTHYQTAPKMVEQQDGDHTKHVVGGKVEAETFPNPSGKGWISKDHHRDFPEEKKFATKEKALDRSRKYAKIVAKEEANGPGMSGHVTSSTADGFLDKPPLGGFGLGAPSKDTHKTTFRLIRPA
jgi:HK97 family phage portal protein